MKKYLQLFILFGFFILAPMVLSAQVPPHPNGGGGPGGSNIPVGGGAPIDGGLTFMIVLGSAYALRKNREVKEEE